jgi:hypothetical protein
MRAQRIPEPELVIPTLELLYAAPDGEMLTSDIISALVRQFRPEGEDNAILEGRADTKFTQKVRNLKSHKTLLNAGFATHSPWFQNNCGGVAVGRVFAETLEYFVLYPGLNHASSVGPVCALSHTNHA